MNIRRLHALDWVMIGAAVAALGVVVYRYVTQRYFDWLDLAYMAVAITGYTKYRTTRTAAATNDSNADASNG